MSEQYHTRPSELLSIRDPYWAWCIDDGINVYASTIEHAIRVAGEQAPKDDKGQFRMAAMQNMLKKCLRYDPNKPEQEVKGQFRDPAAFAKKAPRKVVKKRE